MTDWNELREEISSIFRTKSAKLGLSPSLDLNLIEDAPIVGENVYGEAFPDENRVWLEIVAPDATTSQISETICHELIHILRPDLDHDSPAFRRMVNECLKG